MEVDLIIEHIGELVTLAPLAAKRDRSPVETADLGLLHGAWLAVQGGRVVASGEGNCPHQAPTKVDATGQLVMPGLVDCHTHPLFGGSRAAEFAQRIDGATYAEIAASGGGIQSTVRDTRAEQSERLADLLRQHLDHSLSHGITTQEVKSGYGLTVTEEIRHLEILKSVSEDCPQTTPVTCLALHALPPEAESRQSFVQQMTDELLPEVSRRGLARAVDAFVEEGYFSAGDVEPFLAKARDLGLAIRLHADEFTDGGGASLAAQWGAESADHLQFASDQGIRDMASAGVTAVLLPGTSLYTSIPYTDGRRFADGGCRVAIATDFNPGSCFIDNLPMMATLAGLHGKLRSAEIIAGVTYVAAQSLGLGERKGALAAGFDADFLCYPFKGVAEWLRDIGQTKPQQIWIDGRRQSHAP